MKTRPVRTGHRAVAWLCLIMLALALAAPAPPAGAAPMRGMRPSEAFRMLAREIKDDLQAGDYTKAEKGARRLYDQYAESGNDIESATAGTLLGRVLREQGKYAEAETLLRQALARREKLFGETHDLTITSRFLLAKTLIPLGKYAEAEAVLRRALDAQHRGGRRGSTEELRIVNLLGLVQLQLGRHAEAETLLKQALTDTRDLDDKQGTITRAGTMYLLARALNNAKKFPEAEKYAREAVTLRERLGGAENADVAKTQLVLGRALIGQNKLAEAESLLRRALAVSEKTLGPDHNETAKIVASLAYLAGQRGQTAEAGTYLKRAAENARRANVPAQLAHSARVYAHYLIKQGGARGVTLVSRGARRRGPPVRQHPRAGRECARGLHRPVHRLLPRDDRAAAAVARTRRDPRPRPRSARGGVAHAVASVHRAVAPGGCRPVLDRSRVSGIETRARIAAGTRQPPVRPALQPGNRSGGV